GSSANRGKAVDTMRMRTGQMMSGVQTRGNARILPPSWDGAPRSADRPRGIGPLPDGDRVTAPRWRRFVPVAQVVVVLAALAVLFGLVRSSEPTLRAARPHIHWGW